ncbi:hypothetical protein BgiMline_030936, partial [Biomphalaria glabrata]
MLTLEKKGLRTSQCLRTSAANVACQLASLSSRGSALNVAFQLELHSLRNSVLNVACYLAPSQTVGHSLYIS